MSEPKDVTMPSGAVLTIRLAPFSKSKALYQAILKELKGIDFKKDNEVADIFKGLFAGSFSSIEVEKALWDCMTHCTYNFGQGEFKLEPKIFDDHEPARIDFTDICLEVAKENVGPFVNSLYLKWKPVLEALLSIDSQKLKAKQEKI